MLGAFENSMTNESQYLILYRLQSGWKTKAKYAKRLQHIRTRDFTRQYSQPQGPPVLLPFSLRLEHPQILVICVGPGANRPQIGRHDCTN